MSFCYSIYRNDILFLFVSASRMSTSQVCRPHFHAPLHPWLSDATGAKPLAHSNPWVPFSSGNTTTNDPDKSQSPGGGGGSSAPANQPHPNIFSFPPTPPKDSTPDSVAPSAGAEYQTAVAAAMGAFMHEPSQSCALDVKPSQQSSKQREGSDYEAGNGMFNGNFEGTYGSAGQAAYAHGIHGAAYSPTSHAKAQLGFGQSHSGQQSPNKPRNKSRTSAGKTPLRFGITTLGKFTLTLRRAFI